MFIERLSEGGREGGKRERGREPVEEYRKVGEFWYFLEEVVVDLLSMFQILTKIITTKTSLYKILT